tara:strand:- start:3490 stop:3861 length:372 start_codon:yes stop_codon:yes gene_type:complete
MSDDLSVGEATADLLKELVDEVKSLRAELTSLKLENATLTKAMDDPSTLMRKAGWLRAITPMADEVFDPLNRDIGDGGSFTSAFNSGDGAMITKRSADEELRMWQSMEAQMPPKISPSSKTYR